LANGVLQHEGKENTFEGLYFELRKTEGRIYTDSELKKLPEINKEHLYFQEWIKRKKSFWRLNKYLQQKPLPLKILEIGCGNGWLSAKLSENKNFSIVASDINKQELEQAARVFERKENLIFVYGTMQNFLATKEKFDCVIFAASIQYFKSLHETLEIAKQFLTPMGEIHILDSPFYHSNEIDEAKRRTAKYYSTTGFEQISDFYFHHTFEEIKRLDFELMYSPKNLLSTFERNKNPFYWLRFKT
jgi:ubiquinone/menaquinone biosynthesis C-methylase UbiE